MTTGTAWRAPACGHRLPFWPGERHGDTCATRWRGRRRRWWPVPRTGGPVDGREQRTLRRKYISARLRLPSSGRWARRFWTWLKFNVVFMGFTQPEARAAACWPAPGANRGLGQPSHSSSWVGSPSESGAGQVRVEAFCGPFLRRLGILLGLVGQPSIMFGGIQEMSKVTLSGCLESVLHGIRPEAGEGASPRRRPTSWSSRLTASTTPDWETL